MALQPGCTLKPQANSMSRWDRAPGFLCKAAQLIQARLGSTVAGDPELKMAQHSSSKHLKSPTVGQALPQSLITASLICCYQSSHIPKVHAVTIPVLQTTKLQLREVKSSAQGHTAGSKDKGYVLRSLRGGGLCPWS